MFARLSADPDVIRAYGSASAGHAADLQAVAARLTALGSTAASTSTFGPVGARFQAALVRASETQAGCVTELGGRVAAAHPAAVSTARAYEGADAAAGNRITGSW